MDDQTTLELVVGQTSCHYIGRGGSVSDGGRGFKTIRKTGSFNSTEPLYFPH